MPVIATQPGQFEIAKLTNPELGYLASIAGVLYSAGRSLGYERTSFDERYTGAKLFSRDLFASRRVARDHRPSDTMRMGSASSLAEVTAAARTKYFFVARGRPRKKTRAWLDTEHPAAPAPGPGVGDLVLPTAMTASALDALV